ncbi:MAG TPA: 5-formyltetrahydrofolate cyclo-ligase [Kiritimatiellia bacterium]|nr:5-formyltetrahydrofolate cyclo-ligase [Kiritimatiellia bacterium]
MNKSTLRSRFREMEQNRPADKITSASRAIYEALITSKVFLNAQCIGAYLSLPTEIQTSDIIHACWEQGSTVCVPYYIPEKKYYGMSRLDPSAPIQERQWNVREPENPDPVDPALLDLILVPGMAFDIHGVRLGHGGGHYDRLLPAVKGYRLGIAFHEQVIDTLPREPHDECVQAILTEQKWITTE